jgi:glycerol kinase
MERIDPQPLPERMHGDMALAAPILALDCGTTSVRAIVFSADGEELASAQREFEQHFPAPGLVEHDAVEIRDKTLACAREALAAAREAHGVQPEAVAAIGITNQRETVVVWDRATGAPIARAIVWQDRRTAPAMEALRAAGRERMVREATGLALDPYFSGSKLAWILDHVEGARDRASRGELAAGTIDSWILWSLTSGRVHATDASNASRTMLARIGGDAGAAWDDGLCELLRVPRAVLPEIVDSAGVVATCDPSLLGAAIPVAGIAGDQQAALFGQSCLARGEAKCTFGTGCFLLVHAGDRAPAAPEGLLATVAWRIAGRASYAIEGSVFVGGSAVQWLRDGLQLIAKASEVNALAAEAADAGGVVVVPAFAGLGAPWWDAAARGAILGVTRGTTRAHLARATLEGVAHQVADLVEAIEAAGVEVGCLRVDGGAAASDLLMQFTADLSGMAVERPRVLETTALGAAMLARAGATGEAPSGDALSIERRFEPATGASARNEARARWRRAVEAVRFFGRPVA